MNESGRECPACRVDDAPRICTAFSAWSALTLVVYLQVGRFGFIPIDDNLYVTKAGTHSRRSELPCD